MFLSYKELLLSCQKNSIRIPQVIFCFATIIKREITNHSLSVMHYDLTQKSKESKSLLEQDQ